MLVKLLQAMGLTNLTDDQAQEADKLPEVERRIGSTVATVVPVVLLGIYLVGTGPSPKATTSAWSEQGLQSDRTSGSGRLAGASGGGSSSTTSSASVADLKDLDMVATALSKLERREPITEMTEQSVQLLRILSDLESQRQKDSARSAELRKKLEIVQQGLKGVTPSP